MEDLNVTAGFERRSFVTPQFLMKDYQGKLVRNVPIPKNAGYRSMRRSQMQTVLYEAIKRNAAEQVAAEGGDANEENIQARVSQIIHFGCALDRVRKRGSETNEEVEIVTKDGKSMSCDILVGTDGVSSAVRKSLELPLASGQPAEPHFCNIYCWWGTGEPDAIRKVLQEKG